MTILPDEIPVRLEPTETQKPTDCPIDLLIEPTCARGDLQDLRGAVAARVGHALDTEIAGLRIALRMLAKRHGAVQRRA